MGHWLEELSGDIDQEFLIKGISEGFHIIDDIDSVDIKDVSHDNHPSVEKYHDIVEKELLYQIREGNYQIVSNKPKIVSPLGAIPKGDNGIRIIHDCSRPHGNAVNNYSLPSSVSYETVNNAFKLAKPGSYMCKIDLQSAYRSVPINPENFHCTGLQFKFTGDDAPTYLIDRRLPFGCNKGPMIFHRISQSVKRMMSRKGFDGVVVYLDDFLCVADTYEECCAMQHALLSLLVKLGFQISWKKVTSVTNVVEFLGITIDTTSCCASLSEKKVEKLFTRLQCFQNRKRATKRQLQCLAGSLNWACQVVRGGRFFLRRILDCICLLKESFHKCKLSAAFKGDLQWWLDYVVSLNGEVYYRKAQNIVLHSDACNVGGGVFVQGMWRYFNWKIDVPEVKDLHINYKEVITAILGISIFAPVLKNHDVTVVTDSSVAKAVLNKGRSKNPYVMSMLRDMFWTLEEFNIHLRAVHCPGSLNQLPDAISRLHEEGQLLRLKALLSNWFHGVMPNFVDSCKSSMSPCVFQTIQRTIQRWHLRLN